MNPISGYELAKEVISRCDKDAVVTMLRYAEDSECDFLELKASILGMPEDLHPGEKPEDMYWNIAKELIAMMNTRGGLLLIGVDDKSHSAVSLKKGDKDNVIQNEGIEAYLRKVVNAHIVPENQKWKYMNSTFNIPTPKNLEDYLERQVLNYLGEPVIAFLVKPCEKGDFITVKKHWKSGEEGPEILPRRLKGHIGECEQLDNVTEIINHIRTREIEDSTLAAKLNDLLSSDKGYEIYTLPVRNPDFCGREDEIKNIYKIISKGKIPILHGEAGTGKTELACEFAHRYRGLFPGGCLFLSMENVNCWETALNMIYDNQNIRQVLGHIPAQDDTDRASRIFSKLISNLNRGNILVVLDNMNKGSFLTYNELMKGHLANYLRGPRRVCILATTRNAKATFGNSERDFTEVVELDNLDPAAAFKLLCSRLPKEATEGSENREYIRQIVQELDNHAWSTEITGGYLSRNFDKLNPPPLKSFLESIKNSKPIVDAPEAPWRGGKKSVEELLNPTIAKLEGNEGDVGKRALMLARCIAFFPHNGVTSDPLRFIWKKQLKYPDSTDSINEFNRSLSLLKQYALVGNDMVGGRIRMHHLTQNFFRHLANGDDPKNKKLADALSKTISQDTNCPPRFWAEIAKDNLLMAHCPWSSLDGSASHDIVTANPAAFASKIDWRKLDGYDVVDLLAANPELAKHVPSLEVLYHDDSESPCKAFALLLSRRPNKLVKRCDFTRFTCRDVVYLLAHQPQLAKYCEPAIKNFTRKEWSSLLSRQPDILDDNKSLATLCKWDRFKDDDWMRILARKPDMVYNYRFTSKHEIKNFSTFKWAYLISYKPDFFINHQDCPKDKIAQSARAAVIILTSQPQLAKNGGKNDASAINFDFGSLSPMMWTQLLSKQPTLAEHCDCWSRFRGRDWAALLAAQPQFATKCDFDKLDGNDWGLLLVKQPQLATPDAWKRMAKQPHDEFLSPVVRVIYNHPELTECQRRDLSSLSMSGKRMLLSRIPALSEQIDTNGFKPMEWARLVTTTPHYAEKCPFKDINPVELAVILNEQPQLKQTIMDRVSPEKWDVTSKILEDKTRALLLSDLLWDLDNARMTCDLNKLIIASANLAWTYFMFGMHRPAKHYLELLEKCLKKCDRTPVDKSALLVANPRDVIASISSMLDLLEPDDNEINLNIKSFANTTIFVRRFKKSKYAEAHRANLDKAIKAHKLKTVVSDMADFSSPKTRRKITELQKASWRVVCLNFEERMPNSFPNLKKREEVRLFHETSKYIDKHKPDNLNFDCLVTISPMLLQTPPSDVGERILRAIASRLGSS